MTTGTKIFGSLTGDFYSEKTWTGTDGKYISGSKKTKDNPYSLNYRSFSRSKSRNRVFPTQACTDAPLGYWVSCDVIIPDPWTANDELKLLSRLAEAVRGHSFDLGNFIGEGRETVKTVVGTASQLYRSVKSLKRGDIPGALRALGQSPSGSKKTGPLNTQSLADAWLGLQYGWLPLLSDVYESAVAFEALTSGPRTRRYRVKHTAKASGDASASPPNYSCTATRTHRESIVYRLTEELSVPRSLGLLDPVGVAWELLPFSFVADWFLPIGTYIDTLGIVPGLKGDWVRSVKIRQDSHFGTAHTVFYECDGNKFDFVDVVFSRTVGTGGLSVPTPSFNNPFKALQAGNRIFNAAALLRGLLK